MKHILIARSSLVEGCALQSFILFFMTAFEGVKVTSENINEIKKISLVNFSKSGFERINDLGIVSLLS